MKLPATFLLMLALAGPLLAKERPVHKKPAPKVALAPLLSSELAGADMSFLKTTADSLAAQMALAEIVRTRAQEPQIRVIATALYHDGKREREALVKLCTQKGLPLAATPAISPASKLLAKSLGPLKGPKFDKTAMELMSQQEGDRATTFQAGATSSDAEIRQFAEAYFPAVQESLLLIAKLGGTAQPKPAAPMPIAEPPPAR